MSPVNIAASAAAADIDLQIPDTEMNGGGMLLMTTE